MVGGNKDGIEIAILVCPHCNGQTLSLLNHQQSPLPDGGRVDTYDIKCACGATAAVTENWSYKNADPSKKGDGEIMTMFLIGEGEFK